MLKRFFDDFHKAVSLRYDAYAELRELLIELIDELKQARIDQ